MGKMHPIVPPYATFSLFLKLAFTVGPNIKQELLQNSVLKT